MQFLSNSQQDFLVDIDKLILIFIGKRKGFRTSKTILKNKNEGVTLSDVNGYHIATLIETVWYWQRKRYRAMNRIENLDIDPCKYTQQRHKRIAFSKYGTGATGNP